MSFIDYFSRAYVVNLPERVDRRRDMERMLGKILPSNERERVQFFPAIRPDSTAGFPSLGARGCFLSHLEIFRLAQRDGLPNILVMEDDLEISPSLVSNPVPIIESLRTTHWDMAYLGHILSDDNLGDSQGPMKVYAGPIVTAHFYAVNGGVIPQLIQFLETVLQRPPSHPDGGPMHVDGAFTTFRAQNPSVVTLVACPSLGFQRSSSSNITPGKFDRIPGLRFVNDLMRKLLRNRKN